MHLARILSAKPETEVLSIFRDPEQTDDVVKSGASPLVLSLEDDPKEKFTDAFEGKDIVYFSAGAGEKGGPERIRKVDCEGALKVFDAIESVKGEKPRLILVSAVDIRDPNVIPAHYVRLILTCSLNPSFDNSDRQRTTMIRKCRGEFGRLCQYTCRPNTMQIRISFSAPPSSGPSFARADSLTSLRPAKQRLARPASSTQYL